MIKALQKAIAAMRHSGGSRAPGWLLPRTRYDYRKEVGDMLGTSVVTAPVQWVQRALPEARLTVRKLDRKGGSVDLFDHGMLQLINRPNAYYGDVALWWATVLSLLTAGNAYWIIVRNATGRPAELWYVPHWTMKPVWPQDGTEYLSHYRYSPGGGAEPARVDAEDVVHFRHGIDPHDIRMGLSPLYGAIREIFMDLESSNFVGSLLRNMGVPGVVVSPKGGAMPTPDDVAATKQWFTQAFGGDRRGAPLVMGAPTDVQPYGWNPQQMNMGEARDIAEERVCACLGIPAAVVGFGSGLQSTKVGATMEEMRKLAWHNGVLPVAKVIADELQRSLLPLFERNTAGLLVGWDTSDVPALQEDEDKKTERWNKRVAGGWVMVSEARAECGLDVDESHNIYLRPISMIEVPGRPTGKGGKARAKAIADNRATDAQYARGAAFALMVQRQSPGLIEGFETRLNGMFRGWGKDAADAARPLIESAAPKGRKNEELTIADILARLGIEAWQSALSEVFQGHYLTVAEAIADAAERAGLGASLPDPVARAILAAGGRRAGMIDIAGQTREALFDALAEGRAAGEGAGQLADRIARHVEGGWWQSAEMRARVIARTETKYAQNVSTIERARAGGVGRFVVFDGRLGPGRSKPSHIARDGSIVSADEAMIMASAEHPNGTLSFAPHFDDGAFQEDGAS